MISGVEELRMNFGGILPHRAGDVQHRTKPGTLHGRIEPRRIEPCLEERHYFARRAEIGRQDARVTDAAILPFGLAKLYLPRRSAGQPACRARS
jgi:hypothetical protein